MHRMASTLTKLHSTVWASRRIGGAILERPAVRVQPDIEVNASGCVSLGCQLSDGNKPAKWPICSPLPPAIPSTRPAPDIGVTSCGATGGPYADVSVAALT